MNKEPSDKQPAGRVLVTGARGFVGSALCRALRDQRYAVSEGRRGAPLPAGMVVDVVVHLASRVHMMGETASDVLPLYRAANTDATLKLAREAAAAGVRRFVFVSTVKVNGEGGRVPYREADIPAPSDPYAISKWEAEQGLREIAAQSAMEVVIVRPPLVYGPGVKANFLAMMRWVSRGLPLPLGAIDNRRSLVALDNLVDFLIVCCAHPAAANQTFLVSDGEDLSTSELLRRMACALGRPARLLPVPAGVLHGVGTLLGKREFVRRLCGSLCADIGKARALLAWSPPLGVDAGLRLAAADFLEKSRRGNA